MLVVHPSVPATNLQEFIALAKSQPGGLDYASSGIGTSPASRRRNVQVAWPASTSCTCRSKATPRRINALLGGHVKIYFALVPRGPAARQAGTPARACRHHRKTPALPAGRADHRRARLPRLRDQLMAGRVRAGRHAEGGRRQDQRRARRAWSTRRRCARGCRAKAPIRSAARPSNSPSASRARSPSGAKVIKNAGVPTSN